MTKRKVLIVTVGTGLRTEKEYREKRTEEKFKSADSVYMKTKYFFEEAREGDDEKTEPTPWVAEVLIKDSTPDIVIIMGTVKSAWSDIYKFFSSKPQEDIFKQIHDDYENGEYDKDTQGDDLIEFQNVMEAAYKEANVFGKIDENIKVYPLLTRYGVNKEELSENYRLITDRIGGILTTDMQEFGDEVSYEVSFDITHSFRSLPIYNLAILNYFKNVSEYDVNISHVYYGNFEVGDSYKKYKYEEDGVEKIISRAPIVDLSGIINTMDLTGGVTEFRNTGNSIALQDTLKSDDKLRECLIDFDWAVQANVYGNIVAALIKLVEEVGGGSSDGEGTENNGACDIRYENLKSMIRHVIHEDIFEGKFADDRELITYLEDEDDINVPEIQYLISEWYRKQNRYGQAVTTAAEALTSFVVRIVYEERYHGGSAVDRFNDWVKRQEAVKKFLSIMDKESCGNDDKGLLIEISKQHYNIRPVRNAFAHILNNFEQRDDDQITLERSRGMIEDYVSCVGKLRDRYKEDKDALTNALSELLAEQKNDGAAAKEGDDDLDVVLLIVSKHKKIKDEVIDCSSLNESIREDIHEELERKTYTKEELEQGINKIIDRSGLDEKAQEAAWDTIKLWYPIIQSNCLKRRVDSVKDKIIEKKIKKNKRKKIVVEYFKDESFFEKKYESSDDTIKHFVGCVKELKDKYGKGKVYVIYDLEINFNWKVRFWLKLYEEDLAGEITQQEMAFDIDKKSGKLSLVPKDMHGYNKKIWGMKSQ